MTEILNNGAMDPPVQLNKQQNYTPTEENAILALKTLTLETIHVDMELERRKLLMRENFEIRYNEINDKRMKILEDLKKTNNGDLSPKLTKFWLHVLKDSYIRPIHEKDEQILAHLIDIRSKLYMVPEPKFVIEFNFEQNDYFADSLLTKTYYLKCQPEPEKPFVYDGAGISKSEGCKINWKDKVPDYEPSFFEIFLTLEVPKKDDPNYDKINSILENDFQLGCCFRETFIPKAAITFTDKLDKIKNGVYESDSEEAMDFEFEDY